MDEIGRKQIEITCPNCQLKFKKRVGDLAGPGFVCPGCGAKFDTGESRKSVDEMRRALDKFKKGLKPINFKIRL